MIKKIFLIILILIIVLFGFNIFNENHKYKKCCKKANGTWATSACGPKTMTDSDFDSESYFKCAGKDAPIFIN